MQLKLEKNTHKHITHEHTHERTHKQQSHKRMVKIFNHHENANLSHSDSKRAVIKETDNTNTDQFSEKPGHNEMHDEMQTNAVTLKIESGILKTLDIGPARCFSRQSTHYTSLAT